MNTAPSPDDLIEGAILGIANELMPFLENPKAVAIAQMVQSVLQSARQQLAVYDAALVAEHNDMTRTLRAAAEALTGVDHPSADRVRERAATLGATPDLPAPLDRPTVMAAHRTLGFALQDCLGDLDAIQRAGGDDAARADAALLAIRGHLGPRYVGDMQAAMVGAGFIGRG